MAAVVILLVASYLPRGVRARHLWRAIGVTRRARLRKYFWRAGAKGVVLALAALATAGAALWVPNADFPLAPWILIAVAFALAFAGRTAFLAPQLAYGSPVRSLTGYTVAIGILLVAYYVRANTPDWPGMPWTAVVVAATVAVALLAGWTWGRGGSRKKHGMSLVVTLTTAAGAAVAGAIPSLVLESWTHPVVVAVMSIWLAGSAIWWLPCFFRPWHTPNDAPLAARL